MMKRRAVAAVLGVGLAAVLAVPAVPAGAATPKAGQFCKKADAGKRSGKLVCAKSGARYRWKTKAR